MTNDEETFMVELSGFLKELQCPYSALVTGHLSDRLHSYDKKIQLIDFLITELMTLRMCFANKPANTSNVITIVNIFCFFLLFALILIIQSFLA